LLRALTTGAAVAAVTQVDPPPDPPFERILRFEIPVCAASGSPLEEKRTRVFTEPYKQTVPSRVPRPPPELQPYVMPRKEIEAAIRQNDKFVSVEDKGPVDSWSYTTFKSNRHNEDGYDVRTQLPDHEGVLAAVFDGHSGGKCRDYLQAHFFDLLETFHRVFPSQSLLDPDHFELIDELYITLKMSKKETEAEANHGAVMVSAHVRAQEIEVAWAGDCRAIVGRRNPDGTYTSIPLTKDHDLHNPREVQRLQDEHPFEPYVRHRRRVKGYLQPSRGFGDSPYKRMESFMRSDRFPHDNVYWTPPYVTARPDNLVYPIHENDEFLVPACDGLFTNLETEDVAEVLGAYLESRDPSTTTPTEHRKFAASVLLEESLYRDSKAKFGGGLSRDGILTKLLKLAPKKRRKIYDDTTVLVLFLRPEGQRTSKPADRPLNPIAKELRPYLTEEVLSVGGDPMDTEPDAEPNPDTEPNKAELKKLLKQDA